MSQPAKSTAVAQILTVLLLFLSVVVLINRYLIRQHQSELSILTAEEKVHLLWDRAIDRLSYADLSMPVFNPVSSANVYAKLYTPAGELVSSTTNGPVVDPRAQLDLSEEPGMTRLFERASRGESGVTTIRDSSGDRLLIQYGQVSSMGMQYVLLMYTDLDTITNRNVPYWYRIPEICAVLTIGICLAVYLGFLYSSASQAEYTKERLENIRSLADEKKELSVLSLGVDRSNVALVAFNDKGEIRLATKPAADLLHKTQEELVGKVVFDFLPKEETRDLRDLLPRLREPCWEPYQVVLRLPDNLGNKRRFKFNVERFVFDGRVFGVASSILPLDNMTKRVSKCQKTTLSESTSK